MTISRVIKLDYYIDEAHKLPETARQMLDLSLEANDIRNVIRRLKKERYISAAQLLSAAFTSILKAPNPPPQEEAPFERYARLLFAPENALRRIRNMLGKELPKPTRTQLESLLAKVLFSATRAARRTLCASQNRAERERRWARRSRTCRNGSAI